MLLHMVTCMCCTFISTPKHTLTVVCVRYAQVHWQTHTYNRNTNTHFVADFGYHTICEWVCVYTRVFVHKRSKKTKALETPKLQISNWPKRSSSPTTWQFGVHYVASTRRWEGSSSRKPGSPQELLSLVCTVVVRVHPRGTVPWDF